MIKVERTSNGIECEMNGKTFDLLAETTVAVEAMAKAMQRSAKVPTTYEKAVQKTIATIYVALIEKGETHEKA